MKYRQLLSILGATLLSIPALAQESASLPFLQANPDIATTAMGNVTALQHKGMSLYGDAYTLLTADSKIEANYSLGIRPVKDYGSSLFNTLGLGYQIAKGHALMAGFRSMYGPKVPYASQSGELGNIHPHDFAIDLGYAILLTPRLTGAIRLSYLNSYIGTSSDAISGSLALSWHDALPSFDYTITASLNNVGSKLEYQPSSDKISLPTDLRLGAGVQFALGAKHNLAIGAEFSRVFMSEVNTLGCGLGYTWNKSLHLRAGFSHASQNNYLSLGAGYDWKRLSLNLSYRHSSVENLSWIGAGIGLNI